MADTFPTYIARLDKLHKALNGPDKEKLLTALGVEAKKDADEAVRSEGSKKGSLADASMSHWRRGRPFELAARFDLVSDAAVEVKPTPRTKGPWRVLEEGRKPGGAFDLVQVGRKRKDGTRRAKSRGRNQGATEGKGTWSDATKLMEDRTPKRVAEAHDKVLRDVFR